MDTRKLGWGGREKRPGTHGERGKRGGEREKGVRERRESGVGAERKHGGAKYPLL